MDGNGDLSAVQETAAHGHRLVGGLRRDDGVYRGLLEGGGRDERRRNPAGELDILPGRAEQPVGAGLAVGSAWQQTGTDVCVRGLDGGAGGLDVRRRGIVTGAAVPGAGTAVSYGPAGRAGADVQYAAGDGGDSGDGS